MKANMRPMIKDFDKLIRPEKYALLGGKKIDVSSIPSRVVIMLSQFDEKRNTGEMNSNDMFYEMVEMAAKVCMVKHPEIDADWILDNTDLTQLTEFVTYVLSTTTQSIEKKTEEAGE